jgi:cadherin EGF LAG seven-pass G-type receptor 1
MKTCKCTYINLFNACNINLYVMKFCVVSSFGEWSRAGCQTEVPDDWHMSVTKPFLVNCTCNHLSIFAVLVDLVDMQVCSSD